MDLNRRDFLGAAAAAVLSRGRSWAAELPKSRLDLLDEVERRACAYFWECADPTTGLVLDRANVLDGGPEKRRVASIAATGFGLSALAIGSARGFLKTGDARERAERTLDFLARRAFHHKGFYFHFLDAHTGERQYTSELSSIDTTWLLCGILHVRQHFDSRTLRRLSAEILNRVDWAWMLNGGTTLSHGWTPETGFLPWRWDLYSELLSMYLLAMGSLTHPIPVTAWDAWERPGKIEERGGLFIESPAPLFVHQYSHAWFDFRNRQDGYADYFLNSTYATRRHREFCLSLKPRFPWFAEDMWGITASDSRFGYIDWGGPSTPASQRIDGTLVPCAAGGSLVFLPDNCSQVLETMLQRYGKLVWTRYGFIDAFHPGSEWTSADVIGIDLGIMLLMAENFRTGSVWRDMMAAPEVRRGFQNAGFFEPASGE